MYNILRSTGDRVLNTGDRTLNVATPSEPPPTCWTCIDSTRTVTVFNARAAISVLLCTRLRKRMEPTEQRTRMPTSSHNPQTPSHAACRPPAHVACIQKRQQAGHNHIQHARGTATPGTRPRGGVNEEGLAVSPARARARPRAGQPCRGSQAGGMACGWWVAGRAHLRRRSVQHRPKAGSSASGSPGRYLYDELLSGLSAQHRGMRPL